MDEGGSCQEAIHRLYHFLDGELTAEKRAEIRQHLDECHPCLDVFDFEAELRSMIAHKCRDRVPDHLRAKVAAAIGHESGPGSGDADSGAAQ